MPPDLRKAHQALDRAVDKLYRRTGFASERERVEHLFKLYEKMSAPIKPQCKRNQNDGEDGEKRQTWRSSEESVFSFLSSND